MTTCKNCAPYMSVLMYQPLYNCPLIGRYRTPTLNWREPMLPFADTRIRGEPMLDEPKLAFRLQHTPSFTQRRTSIRNAAQRPRDHHGIDTAILQWQTFRRLR